MDEQMNNNGYQSQPNPMPNQNKDNYAVAILVLGIVSICCCAPWWYRGIGPARIKHK